MQQQRYVLFGIDIRRSAIVHAPMCRWPHDEKAQATFANHFFFAELERRGDDYCCRMFGDMTLAILNIYHPGVFDKYDLFLPTPVGTDRFIDQDSNVNRLVVDRGEILSGHIAAGLSNSGLALEIETHDGVNRPAMPRGIPFAELGALGADTANMTVGDIILSTLVRLHPDAFAPFPLLVKPMVPPLNLENQPMHPEWAPRSSGPHHPFATLKENAIPGKL